MTIEEILTVKEGENFEFKTAENRFSYTELQKYASAISNEGGGKIVFGITDKCLRKAKALPDFTGTDDSIVRLRLGALITNPEIIRLFKETGDETLSSFVECSSKGRKGKSGWEN